MYSRLATSLESQVVFMINVVSVPAFLMECHRFYRFSGRLITYTVGRSLSFSPVCQLLNKHVLLTLFLRSAHYLDDFNQKASVSPQIMLIRLQPPSRPVPSPVRVQLCTAKLHTICLHFFVCHDNQGQRKVDAPLNHQQRLHFAAAEVLDVTQRFRAVYSRCPKSSQPKPYSAKIRTPCPPKPSPKVDCPFQPVAPSATPSFSLSLVVSLPTSLNHASSLAALPIVSRHTSQLSSAICMNPICNITFTKPA
jgi:hypothetical protein